MFMTACRRTEPWWITEERMRYCDAVDFSKVAILLQTELSSGWEAWNPLRLGKCDTSGFAILTEGIGHLVRFQHLLYLPTWNSLPSSYSGHYS